MYEFVRQSGRIFLYKQYASKTAVCFDIILVIPQRQRAEHIRKMLSAPHEFFHVGMQHAVIGTEKIVQDAEAFYIIQRLYAGGQPLHPQRQPFTRPGKKSPRFIDIFLGCR